MEKVNIIIRIAISLYVLYLGYGVLGGISSAEGGMKIVLIIGAIVLIVCPLIIIALSIKALIKKEYKS